MVRRLGNANLPSGAGPLRLLQQLLVELLGPIGVWRRAARSKCLLSLEKIVLIPPLEHSGLWTRYEPRFSQDLAAMNRFLRFLRCRTAADHRHVLDHFPVNGLGGRHIGWPKPWRATAA
jgi:hypothetical protein